MGGACRPERKERIFRISRAVIVSCGPPARAGGPQPGAAAERALRVLFLVVLLVKRALRASHSDADAAVVTVLCSLPPLSVVVRSQVGSGDLADALAASTDSLHKEALRRRERAQHLWTQLPALPPHCLSPSQRGLSALVSARRAVPTGGSAAGAPFRRAVRADGCALCTTLALHNTPGQRRRARCASPRCRSSHWGPLST